MYITQRSKYISFVWENGSVYSKAYKGERILKEDQREIAYRTAVLFIFFLFACVSESRKEIGIYRQAGKMALYYMTCVCCRYNGRSDWPIVGLYSPVMTQADYGPAKPKQKGINNAINNVLTSNVRSLRENLKPQPYRIDLAIARSTRQGLGNLPSVPTTAQGHEAINGGWSSWTSWNTCDKTCGDGIQHRIRRCDRPKPQNGGLPCYGNELDQRKCNVRKCPVCKYLAFYFPA